MIEQPVEELAAAELATSWSADSDVEALQETEKPQIADNWQSIASGVAGGARPSIAEAACGGRAPGGTRSTCGDDRARGDKLTDWDTTNR